MSGTQHETNHMPWGAPGEICLGAPWPEREREYSPSSCIGGHYQPFIAAYRQRSAQARHAAAAAGGRWSRHSYGAAPLQGIEWCLPAAATASRPAALLLFVHGGYWQELSAADSLFAAAACIERGFAFAALDYTLAPAATLENIIDESRQALTWIGTHAAALGIDRERIVIAGSSAGAHLSAMMALPQADIGPATPAGARITPRAAVLVSGIYWLEPLIGTSIDEALRLSRETAHAASPALHPLVGFPPALVCWGEIETSAFKQQSRHFAARLREAGTPCELLEVPQRNHFDVILGLADETTALGRGTLGFMG